MLLGVHGMNSLKNEYILVWSMLLLEWLSCYQIKENLEIRATKWQTSTCCYIFKVKLWINRFDVGDGIIEWQGKYMELFYNFRNKLQLLRKIDELAIW